jgi:uncharacterized protein (TIGR03086 family)
MNIPELYSRAIAEFDRRVQAIEPDQWESSTPCTEWNLRTLVNHVVYELKWTPPMLEGKSVEEIGDAFDGDLLGDDPKTAWKEASQGGISAVHAPGAMERTVQLSFGETSGREYVGELVADHFIHSWDVARAIGADDKLDPELVRFVYEGAKPIEDKLKSYGVFGDKIEPPADADLQTKLLAIFGRRV